MPPYRFNLMVLIEIAIGAAAGYGFSSFMRMMEGTRAFPIVILVLVAATAIAFYAYLFIWASRQWLLFLTLGFSLGALLNRAFAALFSEGAAGSGSS